MDALRRRRRAEAGRLVQVTRIEFPPGSGRIADYTEDELAFIRELVHSGSPTAANEARFIIDAKVELGARIVPDDEATFVLLDVGERPTGSPFLTGKYH